MLLTVVVCRREGSSPAVTSVTFLEDNAVLSSILTRSTLAAAAAAVPSSPVVVVGGVVGPGHEMVSSVVLSSTDTAGQTKPGMPKPIAYGARARVCVYSCIMKTCKILHQTGFTACAHSAARA